LATSDEYCKENTVMIGKVIAATLVASLAMAAAAVAAQPFGRDSVHASEATNARDASVANQAMRAGRDSVYATQSAAGTHSLSTAHSTTHRYGRT
jgi:hypothetical protein